MVPISLSDDNKKEKPSEPEVVAEDTAAFVDDWDAAFGSENDVPLLDTKVTAPAKQDIKLEQQPEAPKSDVAKEK